MKKKLKIVMIFFCSFILSKNAMAQCNLYSNPTIIDNSNNHFIDGDILSNPFYEVRNDVYIDGNVQMNGSIFLMKKDVKVYIRNTAALNIIGCRFMACGDMWGGIEVQSSFNGNLINSCGKLSINEGQYGATIIEDAFVAIGFDFSDPTLQLQSHYPQPTNISLFLDIENTIFNRNQIGIQIKNFDFEEIYTQGASIQNSLNTYPFAVKNSVFTCREILPNLNNLQQWETVAQLKTSNYWNSSMSNNLSIPFTATSPYIDETIYSSTNNGAFLKKPLNTQKSKIGINIITGIENAISFGSRYGHYSIGDNNYNINGDWNTNVFDNLHNGIKCVKASLEVKNATFQNLIFDGSNTVDGVGINIKQEEEDPFLFLRVFGRVTEPKCAFFDCKYAIKSKHIQNIEIDGNEIRSIGGNNKNIGAFGVYVESWRTNNFRIENNNIYNINDAIIFRSIPTGFIGGTGWRIYGREMNIRKNKIGDDINLYNQPLLSNRVLRAITIEVAQPATMGGFNCTWIDPYNNNALVPCTKYPLRISENIVTKYVSGIRVSSVISKDIRVLSNNISLDVSSFGDRDNYGIRLEGCVPQNTNTTTVLNNNLNEGNFVYGNKVIGSAYYSNSESVDIEIVDGNNFNINCNEVSRSLHGINIVGDITPNSNLFNNLFINPSTPSNEPLFYGLTLFNNGTIGQQGSATSASDNQWIGYWGNSGCNNTSNLVKILNDFSAPILSPLYVRQNLSNYDPTCYTRTNQNYIPQYSFIYNNLFNGSASSYPCTPLTYKVSNNNNQNQYINSPAYFKNNINQVEQTIAKPITSLQTYNKKLQLWQSLQSVHGFMQQESKAIKEFVQNPEQEGFIRLREINSAINQKQTVLADQLINNWQTSNVVESNIKQYYSWFLNGKPNLDALLNMAKQCPITHGTIVYSARAWYNSLTNQNISFINNCKTELEANKSNDVIVKNTLECYPNPANTFVRIKNYNYKTIEIFNSFGVKVLDKKVEGNVDFQLPLQLTNGIYFIKACTINNTIFSNKILINN